MILEVGEFTSNESVAVIAVVSHYLPQYPRSSNSSSLT